MELTHYLSRQELTSLDKERVKSQLQDRLALNQLLGRPVNRTLLNEVKLVLEGRPVPRPRRHVNGPVKVIKVSPEEMEKLWK